MGGADVVELPAESFPAEALSSDVQKDETAPADGGQASVASPPVFDHVDAHLAQKVVVDAQMESASREQYRRLAATLHRMQAESGLKAIMIGSAVASEGKTLTAANLALTLSESYRRRVLLVDADFRRPSQHEVFKVPGTPGLMDGLKTGELSRLPVHRISSSLSLLTAGTPTSDPMAALTSESMTHVLAEAREAFDWVIVDTPPVGLLADAHLLASMLDGTLLVVRAESTPFALVKHTVEVIGADHLLGVVLNGASERSAAYGYGYGYGYGYHRYATAGTPSPPEQAQ
jgi:capsular exopolysaccharide synthesis family protein